MIGTEIGKYVIERQLGEGGMGAVYLARHSLIDRHAAIKVLLPDLSHKQESVARFFNEAKATTAIRHPGIVEVYDFGHQDGRAFIVMEYLEGESLKARIAKGVSEPAEALGIMRQVSSALEAAHGKGVIHRDLKPDNIFIVRDPDVESGERTKILDFGIAKLMENNLPGALKTRTGAVVGTPSYMAPEQCKGSGHVDGRADIYALGCILFEMLSGRRPFVGEGAGEVLAAQIHVQPPDPRSLNPALPARHASFVLRLLAKEPKARPQSAKELTAEIDALMGKPVSLSESRPVSREITVALDPTLRSPLGQPDTTLGAAVGATATDEAAPPTPGAGRRSRSMAWLAGAVVVVGGVALALTFGSSSAGRSSARSAVVSNPDAARAAPRQPTDATVATAATDAAVAATKLQLVVNSAPQGALVFLKADGRRLGKTPYVHHYEAAPGSLAFVLKLNGFKAANVDWPANRGGTTSSTLERTSTRARTQPAVTRRRRPAAVKAATKAKSSKAQRKPPATEESVNPYQE